MEIENTSSEMSYGTALAELEGIVEKLEAGAVSIDQLEEKVARAAELLKYCDSKLKATASAVKTTIQEIKDIASDASGKSMESGQKTDIAKEDDLPF